MADLSRQTGISKYALHKIYHEKNKGIQFATLDKLCRALECPVGELLAYYLDRDE